MSKKPTRRTEPGKTATKASRGTSPAGKPKTAAKQAVDDAIATELAPAVAIAMLAKTDTAADAPAPALEALAAGASPSEDDAKVRVQVVFENGSVLPIEMSKEAGTKLSQGLADAVGGGDAVPPG